MYSRMFFTFHKIFFYLRSLNIQDSESSYSNTQVVRSEVCNFIHLLIQFNNNIIITILASLPRTQTTFFRQII